MKRLKVEQSADWHVFARGTRRLVLFREDQDYELFLAYLKQALLLAGCTLWAFTLMSNHYHLAIRATSQQLAVCMHHVNRLYSRYHNRKYGLNGHTFDGPYQAYRQGTLLLFLRTIAYIFLNPVTAELVGKAEDYRWTCYRSFMGLGGDPLTVNPLPLFEELGESPRDARDKFLRIMEMENRRLGRKAPDRLTASEVQAQHFVWLLEEARSRRERFAGEDPESVALYWAHLCGVRPGAAARVLGGVRPETLRSRLYRFRHKLESDPELKERVSLP